MEMIAAAEVKEDDEEYQSPLDELFERLGNKKSKFISPQAI